jgi:hypothetical protein
MACCRPSRAQIARDGGKGIIISTIEVNGAPETALIDKNTSYVVANYNTLRGALHVHALFLRCGRQILRDKRRLG